MPGLARKSGWNAVRTEPFDFSLPYTSCAVCRYSGATKGTFIQQGGSASATRAGAGAGPRPGQALTLAEPYVRVLTSCVKGNTALT